MAWCNRGSVLKFTSEICNVVFDTEELQESSLTGKVSNFQKNKDAVPKKQLFPNRVKGMLGNNVILQYFHNKAKNLILL